jgi:Tol biopolymer transport system component
MKKRGLAFVFVTCLWLSVTSAQASQTLANAPLCSTLSDETIAISDEQQLAYTHNDSAHDNFYITNTADTSSQVEFVWGYSGDRSQPLLWSEDGKQLFYVASEDNSVDNIYTVDSNRWQKTRLTDLSILFDSEEVRVEGLSFSPDKKQIVFSARAKRVESLYILTLSTGAVNLLTDGVTHSRDPIWSPDGKTIVFTQGQRSATDYGLYFINSDGSNMRPVLGVDSNSFCPTWSIDGASLFWCKNLKTYRTSVETNTTEEWFNDALRPTWSPDGQHFLSIAGIIYRFTADFSEICRLVDLPQLQGMLKFRYDPEKYSNYYEGFYGASWSPDGQQIAFAMKASYSRQESGDILWSAIFVTDRNGNQPRFLFQDSGAHGRQVSPPSWQPTYVLWSRPLG